MIKLGHKNIGGIFQSFDNLTYRDRYDGMAQALKEHGLDCRPSHMLFDINPEDMGTTPGRILQLLQKPDRPEAIFCLQRHDRLQYLPGLLHPWAADSGPYVRIWLR